MTATFPSATRTAPPGGLHRAGKGRPATMRRPRRTVTRRTGAVLAAAAAIAVAVYGGVMTGTDREPTRAAAVTVAATPAEAILLAELREAGVPVPAEAQPGMVAVARKHVAHGHLVGMRESIRADVRATLPGLTVEQVDTARVVVEHHFLRITGRKQ